MILVQSPRTPSNQAAVCRATIARCSQRVPPDPTFVLSHATAAAVVHDTDDRPAMLRAGAAIASGNERAASRFGFCMAAAIVDELRNGQGWSTQTPPTAA